MVVLTSLTYLLTIAHNLPQNGIVRVKVGSVVVLYWFVYRFNGRFCDEKENRPVHEVEDGELVTRGLRMKQSWRRQGKRVGVKWRTSKNYLATQTDYIEGAANLDLLIDEIDRMEKLVDQASTLHDRFSTDVKSRDTNYALGIKFITKYFEIVEKTEPTVLATPKLATLLHTTHYTHTHTSTT